jgi:hypothetical protein
MMMKQEPVLKFQQVQYEPDNPFCVDDPELEAPLNLVVL